MKKKGRKLFALLLALVMLVGAVPLTVSAAEWYENNPAVKQDGDYYYTVYDTDVYGKPNPAKEAVVVAAVKPQTGDVVVPNTLGGYPVTRLWGGVFSNNTEITSVVLPESVIQIGDHAFDGCTSLESVTAKGAKFIGIRAFLAASKLTQITVSDDPEEVGRYALDNCGYYNDPNNWEDGVLYLGKCLIKAKYAEVIKKCTIKEGTRVIAEEAFLYSDVVEVYMPDSVKSIGVAAFQGSYCLQKLRLSESLTKIPERAFMWCKDLTELVIPESITELGSSSFDDCDSLTEVRIPAAVEKLDFAFGECSGVKEYVVDPANKNYYSENGIIFKDDYIGKVLISYPGGRTDEVYELPNDVKRVGGAGFSGCEALKEVKIGDNCKDFFGSVFENCISLEKVNFPKGIQEIYGCMFEGCGSLSEVTIPDTVVRIGDFAFKNCKSLKTIEIPSSVKTIGTAAFFGCPSLNEVTIRSADVDIYMQAFGCNSYGFDESNLPTIFMNEDLVIKSYKDSTAEQYALENGITFVEIERPVEPSEDCPCRCHKDGFDNLIYKILRIFWKLFRTHEFCECGAKHY